MLAAAWSGDAQTLAVNMDHGYGSTLLHYSCEESSSSPVIPLLLAHPDIDVNVKGADGETPFKSACYYGNLLFVSC